MSGNLTRLIGPFDFLMPTRLVWHSPAGDSLVEELGTIPARSALIVTDPGVAAAGLVDPLTERLVEAGIEFSVHADVSGNPTTQDVAAARAAAARSGAEVVVALGGGSVIDTAKATAMLLANGGVLIVCPDSESVSIQGDRVEMIVL